MKALRGAIIMADEVMNDEEIAADGNPALDHLAAFIIEVLIKEDVNSFLESDLLHDLLVYKLKEVAVPMMENTVRKAGLELKSSKVIDLKKRVGGINQQKRIIFRTEDQYNALVSLFFEAIEDKPGLVDFIDDETSFENFMIYCINDYREQWERFVDGVVQDRLALERKNKLYANRDRNNDVWEKIPTYADYIAERIDSVAGTQA